MRRFALTAAFAIALTMSAFPLAPTAAATTYCTSENVNFQYYQMIDRTYETLTIHASGCYNGSTSWGTHIRVTQSGPWGVIGFADPQPDPSYFSSSVSGNTWWVTRPVYPVPLGYVFLLSPTAMLSKTGVWYAYDYSTIACTYGTERLYDQNLSKEYYPQLGPANLQGGSGGTGSCASVSAFQPIFQTRWFSSYTS